MISKLKFAKIESFDHKELKALFEHIVKVILKDIPLHRIQQEVSRSLGAKREFDPIEPNPHMIIAMIEIYRLEFELKIKYVEKEDIDFNLSSEQSAPLGQEMEDQRKAIDTKVNPPKRKYEKVEASVEKKTVNESEIPDFD